MKISVLIQEGFSAQHYLLSMLEKWKSATDNRKTFGALLIDLSKALVSRMTS